MFEKAISEACHLAFKRPEYVIPCPEEKTEQEPVAVPKSSPETPQLRSSSRSKSKKTSKKGMKFLEYYPPNFKFSSSNQKFS